MVTIDLNADAGESFGVWHMGDDAALFPQLSSVNLACGFHAGDPLTMQQAVALAKQHAVAVGAHPGFMDKVGFGRREIQVTPEQVYADCLYQLGALEAFLRCADVPLHHVKPHGALHWRMLADEALCKAVAQAVQDYDAALPLVVLAASSMERWAQEVGVPTVAEAFPERAYMKNGGLAPRRLAGSSIHDPAVAAERARAMALGEAFATLDGSSLRLQAQTLCIHGDNPQALQIAQAIRQTLLEADIHVAAY